MFCTEEWSKTPRQPCNTSQKESKRAVILSVLPSRNINCNDFESSVVNKNKCLCWSAK